MCLMYTRLLLQAPVLQEFSKFDLGNNSAPVTVKLAENRGAFSPALGTSNPQSVSRKVTVGMEWMEEHLVDLHRGDT